MRIATLRELLERRRDSLCEYYPTGGHATAYRKGADAMLQLLLPCVEALEEISTTRYLLTNLRPADAVDADEALSILRQSLEAGGG